MSVPRHQPMLATPWQSPFDDPAWWFEPKWDGVRALATWDGVGASVQGRRGNDITAGYPELADFRLPAPGIVDGEIVALGGDGLPSFQRLQRRMHLRDPARIAAAGVNTTIVFVAFDLLYLGESLLNEPLDARRGRLTGLKLAAPFTVTDGVAVDGLALWDAVVDRGMEGMVAKRRDSGYRPGARSSAWRKISHIRYLRAVVGGFTAAEAGREDTLGALLVGLWDGRLLRWVGSVGTGFSRSQLAAIRSALDAMKRPRSPFRDAGSLPSDATWVEPSLVARLGYRDWTLAGRLRHPRFDGFTDDPVDEITWQAEGPT